MSVVRGLPAKCYSGVGHFRGVKPNVVIFLSETSRPMKSGNLQQKTQKSSQLSCGKKVYLAMRRSLSFLKQSASPQNLQMYYNGPEVSIEDAKEHLSQFKGGSVDLEFINGDIATLCINNPDKMNAISGAMACDFQKAVDELETWNSGKGLILFGKNHTFCSGGDLNFVQAANTPRDGFIFATVMQNALRRLQLLPIITVALIEGQGAHGGGAEVAISCDFRLACSNARGINFSHGRWGIIPAFGGITRLCSLLGPRKALDVIVKAEPLSVTRAKEMGLVDEIVGNENAFAEAMEWLLKRTLLPVEVIHAAKGSTLTAAEVSTEEALKHEKRMFAPLWGSPLHKDMLSKYFKEKL